MVPPDVTASRPDPGRAVSVFSMRSHTMRGRSSANSSEGYRPDSMSSTPSRALRGSSAKGAARRTTSSSRSTGQSSMAAMATTCCARTSSGFRGYRRDSMAPARIRSTTTAHSTRSPRNFGNRTPRLGSPTLWPDRPTRCMPLATEGGGSTWITRSTAAMSIPSSSELVATTAGRRPCFSASSIWSRCSRLTDPWWALAISSPASSFSLAVRRSASRLELAKTMVERWARTSSTRRRSMAGHALVRSSGSGMGPDIPEWPYGMAGPQAG